MKFEVPQRQQLASEDSVLEYGRDTRCAKQPPGVRDAFSEAFGAKNRLLRYGRDIRYQKQPSLVRDASSVRGTASARRRANIKKRVLIKVYQDFLEYTLLFEPQNYWSAWQDSSGKNPPLTAKKGICAFWLCGIRYRRGWRSASGSPPPQNLRSRSPLD